MCVWFLNWAHTAHNGICVRKSLLFDKKITNLLNWKSHLVILHNELLSTSKMGSITKCFLYSMYYSINPTCSSRDAKNSACMLHHNPQNWATHCHIQSRAPFYYSFNISIWSNTIPQVKGAQSCGCVYRLHNHGSMGSCLIIFQP